jgi:chromate transport protein ChrA
MYLPGILIKTGILSIWKETRTKPCLASALKGFECGAVGIVFAAVYRLSQIGLMNNQSPGGTAIDREPWFVLIAVVSFTASRWFNVKPPVAILGGGLLGMIWFAVVKPQ